MDTNWFAPVSLTVALLALWIGHSNYRRNNFAIVRVRECECASHADQLPNTDGSEHGPGYGPLYAQLRIVIQNVGIPLHDLTLKLCFTDLTDSGRISLPLKTGDDSWQRAGQFAKGMLAEFSFRSDRVAADPEDAVLLTRLEDTNTQSARLSLFSGEFLVWECRLDGFGTSLKRTWNHFAWRVEGYVFHRAFTRAGGKSVSWRYRQMPTLLDPALCVTRFVHHLRKASTKSSTS